MDKFTTLDDVKHKLNVLRDSSGSQDHTTLTERQQTMFELLVSLVSHIEELERCIDEIDDRTWMSQRSTI